MKKSQKTLLTLSIIVSMMGMLTMPAGAMHIAEGVLPPGWCVAWGCLYLPFLVWGIFTIQRKCKDNPRLKMLLAMSGAYCFVLSALKLPSVSGSSSHPTGVGMGTVLFGPAEMSVLGFIVLVFQALLLAHGGITTLGANAFSMAVAGPLVGYGVFWLTKKCRLPMGVCIFLTAAIADLFTYVVTSFQMALAFHNESVSFVAALSKFMAVFAVTQVPIAIMEGILTVIVYQAVSSLCDPELKLLSGKKERGENI